MKGLLKPETIRVSDLLKSVAEAEFVLPRFQREFVWAKNQVIELLNSIYEQIPIGIFLLWDSDQLGEAFRFIGDVTPQKAAPRRHPKYVLDGQQRLTSLLFSLRPDDIKLPEEIKKQYDIYFSIDDERFYPKRQKNQNCFPAEILGSNDKFMKFYAENANSKKLPINQIILEKLTLFRDYEVPLLIFDEKVDLDIVSKTFQYLNAKGTPLTLINLIAAKTYSPSVFDLYIQVESTQKALEDAHFISEDFTGENLIRSIAIYNNIDTHPRAILESLKTDHIVKDYKKAEKAYLDALIFITDDIEMPIKLLPYITLLVPLTTFFMKKAREDLTSSQVTYIKQWFWRSSFNNRYGSEAVSTGVADFKNLSSEKNMKNIIGLDRPLFDSETLIESATGSAIGKAVLGLLQSYKPLDLYSNIDLKIKGVQKRKKSIKNVDKHHIFPKDYLKTKLKGNTRLLIDSVCNLAWVSQKTNLRIANTPPSRYFKKLQESNKDFNSSADQQFITTVPSSPIWSNNYRKFLKIRAERIYKEAIKKCGF